MRARAAKKRRAKSRAAYARWLKRERGRHDGCWARVSDDMLPIRRLNSRNMVRAFDAALKSMAPTRVATLTFGGGEPFLARWP